MCLYTARLFTVRQPIGWQLFILKIVVQGGNGPPAPPDQFDPPLGRGYLVPRPHRALQLVARSLVYDQDVSPLSRKQHDGHGEFEYRWFKVVG